MILKSKTVAMFTFFSHNFDRNKKCLLIHWLVNPAVITIISAIVVIADFWLIHTLLPAAAIFELVSNKDTQRKSLSRPAAKFIGFEACGVPILKWHQMIQRKACWLAFHRRMSQSMESTFLLLSLHQKTFGGQLLRQGEPSWIWFWSSMGLVPMMFLSSSMDPMVRNWEALRDLLSVASCKKRQSRSIRNESFAKAFHKSRQARRWLIGCQVDVSLTAGFGFHTVIKISRQVPSKLRFDSPWNSTNVFVVVQEQTLLFSVPVVIIVLHRCWFLILLLIDARCESWNHFKYCIWFEMNSKKLRNTETCESSFKIATLTVFFLVLIISGLATIIELRICSPKVKTWTWTICNMTVANCGQSAFPGEPIFRWKTSHKSWPCEAGSWNHRAEAVYRAESEQPHSSNVQPVIRRGLVQVKFVHHQIPVRIWQRFINVHNTFHKGSGENFQDYLEDTLVQESEWELEASKLCMHSQNPSYKSAYRDFVLERRDLFQFGQPSFK